MNGRVLAIGLDGHDVALGERLMAEGSMPNLRALSRRGARFLLDHGAATRTGLAWEHASTGRSPEAAGRASAVDFDPRTYAVWHAGTSQTPFPRHLNARTVVFDPPYFDLERAPRVQGVVNWGAHDPGVAPGSRPRSVLDELLQRFGDYPASRVMYDVCWPSPERTVAMGEALVRATEARTRAAEWLLAERCPDWDLAFVVAGELHSAIENLWHGLDPEHPLHRLPSAEPAARGLRAVHRATDDLIGALTTAFPDARVVAFAMNGMGPNRSDVASMVLLPELLYRHATGRALLRVPGRWARAADGVPAPDPDMPWSQAVKTCIRQFPEPLDTGRRIAARILPEALKRRLRPAAETTRPSAGGGLKFPLDWMPTDLYRPHWPRLGYFALPSFYDGRIRVNLGGREARGVVPPSDYDRVLDELESTVRACRDIRTGEPVVDHVVRCGTGDPLAIGPTECDLIVVWADGSTGFDHPRHGRIGPVPLRRTGGHTGPHGLAVLAGEGIDSGDFGVRESWDVVPTIFRWLGEPVPEELSGRPLF